MFFFIFCLQAYYWSLPKKFLGNKVTSYGGYLNYTIRYVPAPGGQILRDNAPDVEIISVSVNFLCHLRCSCSGVKLAKSRSFCRKTTALVFIISIADPSIQTFRKRYRYRF